MNSAQWHLLVVHVPVMITLCGVVLLAVGAVRKSTELTKTSYVMFIVAGLASVAAYYTGPSALEVLETVVEVEDHYVEQHAVIGRAAFVAGILLAVLALQAFVQYWQGSEPGRVLCGVILLVALGTTYLVAWTAHLGGLIRHTEIREPAMLIFPELPR